MFTGIVEETGTVARITKSNGALFTIRASKTLVSSLKEGDSVSVNGACQTATRLAGDEFDVFATDATLGITNLGMLRAGDAVNLERPLALGGRLDGHLVAGHVDGMARVSALEKREGAWTITFASREPWMRYVVTKGAVAVNGISLTVYEAGADWFSLVIIPYTVTRTNIPSFAPGTVANIEVDMIAKYVERLLGAPGDREAYLKELLANFGR